MHVLLRKVGAPASRPKNPRPAIQRLLRPRAPARNRFAREGGSPFPRLDAPIISVPVGALSPAALAAVRKGGSVIAGGIQMSEIRSFPYVRRGERVVRSVANLTRADGRNSSACG
jgi:hypothetical protein